MSSKGCGATFFGLIGAFFVALGVSMAFDQAVSLGGLLFILALGGMPLWLAWSLWRSDRQDARQRAEWAAEQRERAILMVAAQNQGRVTPALVTANTRGLSIAEAKATLDAMAKAGFCGIDSDAQGHVYYQFDFGQGAGTRRGNLSAEEWVDAMSQRRMSGSDGDSTLLQADE